MYRKHLREMESKTGIKTIDKLTEIPIVNSALDYYGKVKESNALLRTSCNLAELSFRTVQFAATPITTICKGPIGTVDSYLSDKVNQIEHSYPVITKPTEQLTSVIYDKTVKEPIEVLNTMKDKTVQAVVKAGSDQIAKSADIGVRVVDACLENRLARMFTEPMLNLTERSLDYFLPLEQQNDVPSTSDESIKSLQSTTLRRIYDINSRVYKHIHLTTFNQLNKIHFQFENTIGKLQSLKQLLDMYYTDSKEKMHTALTSISAPNTLFAQCAQYVNKNDFSLERLEQVSKNYYKTILDEVRSMVENYMSLVKKFPVAFNATKIKQTVDDLATQINKEQFSSYLGKSIDMLKGINQSMLSFTNQMYKVFSESRFTQFLKRIPSQDNIKSLEEASKTAQQTPSQATPPQLQPINTNGHLPSSFHQEENQPPKTTNTSTTTTTNMNETYALNEIIRAQELRNKADLEEREQEKNQQNEDEEDRLQEPKMMTNMDSSLSSVEDEGTHLDDEEEEVVVTTTNEPETSSNDEHNESSDSDE